MIDFGSIRFINGDCMDLMRETPDNYYDLAVVDVPYGIGADNNSDRGGRKSGNSFCASKDYGKKNWDKEAPSLDYFSELLRVSKNQIIWGANHFISRIPYDSSCWVIWDKDNGTNDYADCELAWTSFNTAVRKIKYKWHGMLQENMKNKELRIHPTQKPIQLYEWILKNYANPNDKILDTHLGSGSIAIAIDKANTLDKKNLTFTGIELDKDYYTSAVERFKNYKLQYTLFQ